MTPVRTSSSVLPGRWVKPGLILCFLAMLIPACAGPRQVHPDPSKEEVRLGSRSGFDAYLVHKADVGVWTVACFNVFERYGCPEIVALDDLGRCTIFKSYSGKWAPWLALQDGLWLGGIAFGDVDTRRAGAELYVGGKRGNIYQVVDHPQGGFDVNTIAYIPGREVHTLVAAELLPERAGVDLVAFTYPGGLYRIDPPADAGGAFHCAWLADLPGRVRDACLLPDSTANSPTLALADDTGDVRLLHFDAGRPVFRSVYKTAMGLGRIALLDRRDQPLVLFVTADDGRVIRLQARPDSEFDATTIHNGPQGPRGLAVGRFTEDPAEESVAVFGYSKCVELLLAETDTGKRRRSSKTLTRGTGSARPSWTGAIKPTRSSCADIAAVSFC